MSLWRVLAIAWLVAAGAACVRRAPVPLREPHPEPELIRVVHVVKPGDTLYRIARTYELSVDELMAANAISDPATLEVGQELLVPGAAAPRELTPEAKQVVRHKVEPGQTLYRIAKTYEVPLDELMAANGISDPTTLSVGQQLVIPDRAPAAPVASASATSSHTTGSPGTAPTATGTPAAGSAGSASPGSGTAPDPSTGTATSGASVTTASSTGQGAASGTPARTTSATRAPPGQGRPDPSELGERAHKGTLDWPLRGVLYGRFGKKGREPHDGIDLAAPAGTPVKTAAEGQVLYAGEQRGYGNIVIVEHPGGLVTLYAHNRDLRVKSGQKLRRGQVIATVGESGRTSGPHLHFEVRKDAVPVDPLKYLGAVPPR